MFWATTARPLKVLTLILKCGTVGASETEDTLSSSFRPSLPTPDAIGGSIVIPTSPPPSPVV